jgi:predicted DNA-binding ribbon-helix-helix protein
MKSLVVKRSVIVKNRKTSVSVEDDFWKGLKKIADSHQQGLQHLIEEIDRDRTFANLSSAIRLFVLGFYKGQFDSEDRISEQRAIRANGQPFRRIGSLRTASGSHSATVPPATSMDLVSARLRHVESPSVKPSSE